MIRHDPSAPVPHEYYWIGPGGVLKMPTHEHEAPPSVRCRDCSRFGVNLPLNETCGDCGSRALTPYFPPCCLLAFAAQAREARTTA